MSKFDSLEGLPTNQSTEALSDEKFGHQEFRSFGKFVSSECTAGENSDLVSLDREVLRSIGNAPPAQSLGQFWEEVGVLYPIDTHTTGSVLSKLDENPGQIDRYGVALQEPENHAPPILTHFNLSASAPFPPEPSECVLKPAPQNFHEFTSFCTESEAVDIISSVDHFCIVSDSVDHELKHPTHKVRSHSRARTTTVRLLYRH